MRQAPLQSDIPTPAPAASMMATIARWFDASHAVSAPGDDRIDWVRVLPFIALHLACLDEPGDGPPLGDFLGGYGRLFVRDHIVPMACALWSSPAWQIMDLSREIPGALHAAARDAAGRWAAAVAGRVRRLAALRRCAPSRLRAQVRLPPVRQVRRRVDGGVDVVTPAGSERFDHVVLACHADDALALIHQPTTAEAAVLGAVGYQHNDTVLHTDARMLPRRRKAWATWNAFVPADDDASCTVSYCMNILQSIDAPTPLVVTLNRSHEIDDSKVLARTRYRHPLYSHASVQAQARVPDISGQDGLWFAGAWCGFGFHEDGLRSGYAAADALLECIQRRRAA